MGTGDIRASRLEPRTNIDRGAAIKEAVSFIIPSVIITASSIVLFSLLTGLTAEQHNRLVTIIFLAIIPSLLGSAGFQVIIYRIIDENAQAGKKAAAKSLLLGNIFAVIFSALVAAVAYVFMDSLGLTLSDYSYFAVLLFLFTMIWVYLAAFWASQRYYLPVLTILLGFLSISALTYLFNDIDPAYTISGYTLGVFSLFVIAAAASLIAFGPGQEPGPLKISLGSIITKNLSMILFSLFYILAFFLDKIIVWIYRGSEAGVAFLIPGPYTVGAFLGLIPIFSSAAVVYFGRATSHLVEKRYEGTLADIKRRAARYLRMYRAGFGNILSIWVVLFMVAVALVYFVQPEALVYRTTATVGVASLFLVLILHNSQFLVTFGEGRIAAASVAVVIACELASAFFVHIDLWYAAAGLLAGAVLGFMLSQIGAFVLWHDFEYHIYRYATRIAGLKWE